MKKNLLKSLLILCLHIISWILMDFFNNKVRLNTKSLLLLITFLLPYIILFALIIKNINFKDVMAKKKSWAIVTLTLISLYFFQYFYLNFLIATYFAKTFHAIIVFYIIPFFISVVTPLLPKKVQFFPILYCGLLILISFLTYTHKKLESVILLNILNTTQSKISEKSQFPQELPSTFSVKIAEKFICKNLEYRIEGVDQASIMCDTKMCESFSIKTPKKFEKVIGCAVGF